MKRDYYEDVQLFNDTTSRNWFGILIVFLILFPFWTSSYYLYILSLMAVNVIVVLGLNMLVGNTGQISLGHAGFVAIGAYSTALLMSLASIPFFLSMIIAGLIAAVFGFLLGLPALRLEGPYLAIVTLGFGLAITTIIGRLDFLGGRMGLTVSTPQFDFLGLTADETVYYLCLTIVVILGVAARNFLKTRPGRAFQSIRDSDIAASSLGINVAYFKTLSFAVSAFYAGVAGGLWTILIGYINPSLFNFVLSIVFLAMVVAGGLGTVLGSVMGGVTVTFLNLQLENVQSVPIFGDFLESFSATYMSVGGMPNIIWVLTGLILILIVIFEPLGLYGLWVRTKTYWKTWPF